MVVKGRESNLRYNTKHHVVITGAAGRDFHNFNVYLRGNDRYEVVAFTAAQIPGIEKQVNPHELAGPQLPRRPIA